MKEGMRVIVCGGRDFCNKPQMDVVLASINAARPFHAIIHGNARGADQMAGKWADSNNIRNWPVPAEWAKYGDAAGPIRNKKMLGMSPNLVVAFPGGKGTRNMVKQAKAAGVEVIEIAKENHDAS